jgi:type II secretory pathway pseudopilin PulG
MMYPRRSIGVGCANFSFRGPRPVSSGEIASPRKLKFVHPTPSQRRSGLTLIETLAAVVVLSAAVVAVAQTVAATARQRELAERRAIALQEAANVLERLQRLTYDEVTAEHVAPWRLSPEAKQRLPDGRLHVTIQPGGEGPAGKRLSAEVDWREADGGRSRPVRLTAWRYAVREGSP